VHDQTHSSGSPRKQVAEQLRMAVDAEGVAQGQPGFVHGPSASRPRRVASCLKAVVESELATVGFADDRHDQYHSSTRIL
jgi:hypothetical protein